MACSQTELAWAAGFFDGEGNIELTNHQHKNRGSVNGKYGLSIDVGVTNRNPLERLQKSFGGNIRERKHILHYRRVYRWTLSGNNANRFLQDIKPFLCVKKDEAEIAINFQKTIGRKGVKVNDKILEYRDTLKFQIQQLHHLGVG